MTIDSIVRGVFLSGNKWRQSWAAVRDEKFSLRDPNKIVAASEEPLAPIAVTDRTGRKISLDAHIFRGKVTVIEVMGTWCPNCLDASRFLDTVMKEIHDTSFQVVPLLFERGEDFSIWQQAATHFFSGKENAPEYYFAGKASKKVASELFPALSSVLAFPTLIIIDRNAEISWVHTGFYGPGTGAYYTKNKNILKKAILQQLK